MFGYTFYFGLLQFFLSQTLFFTKKYFNRHFIKCFPGQKQKYFNKTESQIYRKKRFQCSG